MIGIKAPKETFILKPCDSKEYSKGMGHFFSDLLEALFVYKHFVF